MKIAIVTPAYFPGVDFGGPVTYLRDFVRSLRGTRNDITVYTTRSFVPKTYAHLLEEDEVDGVPVKRYRVAFGVAGYEITPGLFRSLLVDDHDIIHANCARSFQLDASALASKLRRKPMIVSPHGGVANYLVEGVMSNWIRGLHAVHSLPLALSLRSAQRIIAVNTLEAMQLTSIGVRKGRISIVPNGVDFSEYMNLPSRGSLRRKLGIADDEIVVMSLGRLHRTKGVDILIRAFAMLAKEFPRLRLLIIGPDAGFLRYAVRMIESLRLNEKVYLMGALYGSEKIQAYVDSDIYSQPSRYEIFGISLLEAGACGKPAVASKVGGLRDLVIDGKTGFLVDPGDTGGLATALRRLVVDRELSLKMGSEGRDYVLGNFSISSCRDKILSIYESLK